MSKKKEDELLKDFKWIQEEPGRPKVEFEETPVVDRTLSGLLLRKFSENALVPIGLVCTTACLVMGLASMTKGNVHQQQLFMRGRVAFQAMTFVAMTSGVLIAGMRGKKTKRGERDPLDEDVKTS